MAIETTFSVRKDDRVTVTGSDVLGSVMIRASSPLTNTESAVTALWLPLAKAKEVLAGLQAAISEIEMVTAAKAKARAEREAA